MGAVAVIAKFYKLVLYLQLQWKVTSVYGTAKPIKPTDYKLLHQQTNPKYLFVPTQVSVL